MNEQEKMNHQKKGAAGKKEPPKGKVISSDYRELFEELEAREPKEHLKAEDKLETNSEPEEGKDSVEEKHWPDPASAVKAAVKAAQEGFDLLQEEQQEVASPSEPAEESEEEPHFRARGTHRAPRLVTGVIVLLLALVGVGYLATALGTQIYRAVTDDSRERAYDEFLEPLVMQDPDAFSSQESADEQMVLAASLWKALEDNSASYTSYDDAGRTLVPLADVSDACHALFGPDAELQLDDSGTDNFFTFDTDTNQFHVTPFSTQSSYVPYTENIRTEDGKTVLRVGYVAPTDSWRSDEEDAAEEPTPVKYMEYVLEKNGDTEYVAQIREPEGGSVPSSSE